MPRELELASATLVFACGVLLVILIVRRLVLAASDERAAEARLGPIALAVAFGDEHEIPDLSRRDADVFVRLLLPVSARLRGLSRDRITAWFEQEGHVRTEISRLSDRRSWRRATAAYVLGDMGSRGAASALIKALDDPEREVRSAAARSLGHLQTPEGVDPLIDALASGRVPRGVVGPALLGIGAAAVPALLPLLEHPQPEVRAGAAELLGLLGDARVTERLTELGADPSALVRERAVSALGRLGASEAFEHLERALADDAAPVRAAAAEGLGLIGDDRAIPRLLDIARQDLFEPAGAAARALARLAPERLREAAREPGASIHLLEAMDAAGLDAGTL